MDLLNPSAFWLLPLAVIPFLLSRRRPLRGQRNVSSVHLWQAADPREAVQPAVRHVRRDWIAVVQAVFLVAIIGALARPSIAWLAPRAAFIVDVSARMGAQAGGMTRLDVARQQAVQALSELPSRTRVRVIAAAASARDLGEFPAQSAELRKALDGLRAGASRANLADAMDLARAGGANIPVQVFSDAAAPAENVAVTALSARRAAASPQDAQVAIGLFNAGASERNVTLDLLADSQPVAREALRLNPREARILVRTARGAETTVEARITVEGDPLGVDNQRIIVVPPARRVRVRLVTAGNFFLEKALAANPSVELTEADADVIVCDRCATIPPGASGVLVVPAPNDVEGVEPPVEAPLTINAPAHPLAQGLDLAAASAAPTAAWPLEDAVVVLRAGGAPLLSARDGAGQRVAVLNLDLRSPAFPLTTAFPVLVANTLDWLSARNDNPRDISAGEPLQWRLVGSGLTPPLSVAGPDEGPVPFQVMNDRLIVTATDTPGIYSVNGSGGAERFAVNATSVETDSSASLPRLDPQDRELAPQEGGVPTPADQVTSNPSELTTALLIAALGLLGTEWWLMSPAARRAVRIARGAVACLLLLAAAGLAVPTGEGRATVMFALDKSESMSLRAQRAAASYVSAAAGGMRSGDMAGHVVFGSEAVVGSRPSERATSADMLSDVPAAGTDIEAALRLARRSLPPDGARRVVLISDGRQTSGDAQREAALAAADGVRVDVLPVDPAPLLAPRIRGVRAPGEVRAGEPFVVSAIVEGPPESRARVSIQPNDQPGTTRDVVIRADGTASVELEQSRPEPGTFIFRAAVENPEDVQQPVGTALTVTGIPAILYVSTGGAALRPALASAGFRVVQRTPADMPATDAGFASFDAVVLDDVPADAWTAAQASALARYVEQAGGGLLVLGSAASLASPGYQAGPFATLLPIDLRLRPGARAPSAAFVVVFDKSGSMAERASGIQKIELARQAILQVLNVLPPTDALGVIAFDSQPVTVAPLAAAQDSREVAAALRRIEPAGATAIGPALELASKWVQAAPVQQRHVLLVSDGRTSPADMDRVAAAARSGNFELSVVAIGVDTDRSAFTALAEGTGGRAYFPDDLRQLPTIAARDVVRSRGGATVDERFTVRAPAAHPVLTGIDRGTLPSLDGYVASTAKSGAASILTSHLDDPLLAGWRAGLGRVGVFTGDLRSEWSTALRRWPAFGALWSQTVRWVSRRSADGVLRAELTETIDGVAVGVDVERPSGAIPDLAELRARLRSPDGNLQDVQLTAAAPGRLEARVPAQQSGVYQLSVSAVDPASGGEVRLDRSFYWSSQRERLGGDADRDLLARLAEITGGRVLTDQDNPFAEPRPTAYRSIRVPLLLTILLLFLLDLMTGRQFRPGGVLRWWRERRRPLSSTRKAAA